MAFITLVGFLTTVCILSKASPVRDDVFTFDHNECGYKNCPAYEEGMLNVHIIPHTHDDVGWLKTFDQYYYGSKNYIQKAGVQYILDSVIKELLEDSKRRFIYVETAFFWKWWVRQSDETRQRVKLLVQNGQLEFIGGAWSMNDEAATHYQSTIDQFTWGLRKLNDTFGPCGRPRVGWQIDPFGHSREFASNLAMMGYDGLFLGRIDYQDKSSRIPHKKMEMIWRGNDDIGEQSDIFTGVLYNTYSPPKGFCFDVLCSDEPIVDDPESPIFNVDRRVNEFLPFISSQKRAFTSNNIAFTMGGDFTFMNADQWYLNLDKLIYYTNMKAEKDGLNIKLYYSTPSCYLKAVHSARPLLPTKQDDFFPYASDPNSYWTGYFTSRPTVKYFERVGNAYLQMAKQLQVLALLEDHNVFLLNELRSAMGVMQHHDAITGTERQHVADDYARMLDEAIEDSLTIVRQAVSKISAIPLGDVIFDRCQFNISECITTERSQHFTVTLYNPLSWPVCSYIRLPVGTGVNYQAYDSADRQIQIQLVDIPDSVRQLPFRRSASSQELVFFAENLPALGYKTYYFVKNNTRTAKDEQLEKKILATMGQNQGQLLHEIEYISEAKKDSSNLQTKSNDQSNDSDLRYGIQVACNISTQECLIQKAHVQRMRSPPTEDLNMVSDDPTIVDVSEDYISNEHIRMNIDKRSGQITQIVSAGIVMPFDVQFYYYEGVIGDNREPQNRTSGAYILRPKQVNPIIINRTPTYRILKGPLVEEVQFEYANYTSAVIRLYKGSTVIEVEWLVGPIPIQDNIGKEIVVRYSSNMVNDGVFYTDSNGRQTLKRIVNSRPQWNVSIAEPVAGNYYPVVKRIFIQDESQDARLTVINDRAQGGTSLNQGQIELMLHRRLLNDDAFGVGEALNETAYGLGLVARGKHYVIISRCNNEGHRFFEKKKALEYQLPPQMFASNLPEDKLKANWRYSNTEWSGLNKTLPEGLNILTLEPWKGNTFLLRLENIIEKADLTKTNGSLSVVIDNLFKNIKILSVKETALAANLWKKEENRLKFKNFEIFLTNINDVYGVEGLNLYEYVAPASGEPNIEPLSPQDPIHLSPMEIRTFVVAYEPESIYSVNI